ncbi:spore germination protein [Desmospora profundinema]|nr:spore germination protein [Desmospora profundinema]
MGSINKIFNVKLQNVSSAGSVNMGDAINIRSNDNSKSLGGSSPIGDFVRNIDAEGNLSIDPDIVDQL